MGRSQVRRIFRQEGVRWRHTRLWASWASSGSGISYLISDGLGSVSEALNQTSTASGVQLYSPYGTVRYSSGVMPTAKGFTGQYSDAATSGLDYYGARYYDPQLGQFTAADPVTDGLNRYGYVKGNPETYSDPSGHRCTTSDGGVCGTGGNGAPPSSTGGGGGGTGGSNGGGNGDGICNQHLCPPPPPPTGGNGTGGGCHGNTDCQIGYPVTKTKYNTSCGEAVCAVGQHQTGGLFSIMGYDTSKLEFVGAKGIEAFLNLLNSAEGILIGKLGDAGKLDSGAVGAIFAALSELLGLAGVPSLPPLGVGGLSAVGFGFLMYQYQQAAISMIAHTRRYLQKLEYALGDSGYPMVIDVEERQLWMAPSPGDWLMRAQNIRYGTLHISVVCATPCAVAGPPQD